MGNKLFDEHERARAAAEAASRKDSDFLKDSGKAKEPDDVGTASKQNVQIRRNTKGSK
jgi:hypothetical protein